MSDFVKPAFWLVRNCFDGLLAAASSQNEAMEIAFKISSETDVSQFWNSPSNIVNATSGDVIRSREIVEFWKHEGWLTD